jgi:hypothetical protein
MHQAFINDVTKVSVTIYKLVCYNSRTFTLAALVPVVEKLVARNVINCVIIGKLNSTQMALTSNN